MPFEKSMPIEARARELLHAIHALSADADAADLLSALRSMSEASTQELSEIAAALDALYLQVCGMRSDWKALLSQARGTLLR